MESPQRDPRPPTLPTTIQAGPDSTHDDADYHLLILRSDAIQISPELPWMRHPTLSWHHTYLLVLILSMDAHLGRPYLAVICATLGPITSNIAGQYCAT